jgi:hypothetical protein
MSRVLVDTLFSDVRAHGKEERTCSKSPHVETKQARESMFLGYESNMSLGSRENLHHMKMRFHDLLRSGRADRSTLACQDFQR